MERGLLLAEELDRLLVTIGIPPFNTIPTVSPADFPFLAQAAFRNGSTPSNCRKITEEDYLRLFRQNYARRG